MKYLTDMKYFLHAGSTAAFALLALQAAPAFAAGTPPQQHVRGTLSAVSPTALTVATANGSVIVPIGAKTGVLGVVPATASEITTGTFIGTANVAGSGGARALEVVVFPKAMAGTGEGDYPWDLPAGGKHSMMTNGTVGNSGGHSMMTNGTVSGSGHSMMTNATVSHVSGSDVKTVNLTYKGGTKSVTIPADAPIVRIVPGTKALLAAGAHVVVFPSAAGNAPARAVIVGEKGVTPPM